MENPEWRAKFDIQKEANAHSRWAQTEARQRYEFSANYEQKERFKKMDNASALAVAKLKSKEDGGIGTGNAFDLNPDVENSDFNDIMYHQNEVQTAATNMMNNQLEFVWSAMFANSQTNEKVLANEMKKTLNGQSLTREQAIKNIITSTAKAKGYSSYDAYMVDVTSRARNLFNGKQGQKLKSTNPALYDAMINYQESEKLNNIQSNIDKQVKEEVKGSLYDKVQNIEFNDKMVTIGDRKYTLTKDDALQLAIIGKYEQLSYKSKIFGTAEALLLKNAAIAAEAKLENQGKGELVNNWKKSFTGSTQKRKLLDAELEKDKSAGVNRTNSWSTPSYIKDTAFKDVYKIYDALGDDFLNEVKVSASAVRKYRLVSPNVSGSVTTGVTKEDNVTLSNLKYVINNYDKNQNATGVDADEVISTIKGLKNVTDLTGANIIKGVEKDAGGELKPFIQIGSSKLYLNTTESDKLGINPSTIYNDETVIATEGMIASQGGKSSYGAIDKTSTYREESTPLDNNDFPLLYGSGYTVKVNFKKSNNKYYPYLYINDGNIEKVVPFPGDKNLGKLMREVLPSYVSPTTVQQLLNQ
jgi:hypothetical protein